MTGRRFDPSLHRLEPEALERAVAVARRIASELDLDRQAAAFGRHRWTGPVLGEPKEPVLCLDDFSTLPSLDGIAGVATYQHRARVRAGDGDVFATVIPPAPGYESYCRDVLRLGAPELLLAEELGGPMAVARACGRGTALSRLASVARAAGGMVVHPFMGAAPDWRLAARIASAAGAPVRVLAPPPPVTRAANDKSILGEIVSRLLGPEWLVETREAADPAELAAHLAELGRRHGRVALKRRRYVSGLGNQVFDRRSLDSPAGLAEEVGEFLAATGWDGEEPVLAMEWAAADVSPSTQTWIPPAGDGPPRLDGIYEQVLEGERGVFAGSRPSGLPPVVERRLGRAALVVAAALQALGYVGRCSFDHLLMGEPEGSPELKFVDCNGRWGGTSIPMTLVDRLVGAPRPPYYARDVVHPGLVGVRFPELLAAVGDEAFDAASRTGRFIFYNVGPLEEFGKLDVVALGATQEEADAALAEDLPRLLGL